MSEKSFILYGKTFTIPENLFKYNQIKKEYYDLGIEKANAYIKNVYEQHGNIDDFVKKGLNAGLKVIYEAVSYTVNKIMAHQIYDIDENLFCQKYGNTFTSYWFDAYDEINDQYMQIILNAKQLDEYRRLRKESRLKLVGGGFGFIGAMKGIMQAEAFNLVYGLAHDMFNLAGKTFSFIIDSIKKSALYSDTKTKNTLYNGIFQSVFAIHYAYCNVIKLKSISKEEFDSAKALFNNLKKMLELTPQLDETNFNNLVKVISFLPLEKDVYKFCLEKLGDENNELETIANTFGVDIKSIKEQLLKESIKDLKLNNYENTLQFKQVLKTNMIKLGINSYELYDEVEKKLQIFDKLSYIIDGEFFDSKENVKVAQLELEIIEDIVKNKKLNTKEEISRTLEKLNHVKLDTKLKDKYIKKLNLIIEKIDNLSNEEYKKLIESEINQIKNEILTENNIKNIEDVVKMLQLMNETEFKTFVKYDFIDVLISHIEKYKKEGEINISKLISDVKFLNPLSSFSNWLKNLF